VQPHCSHRIALLGEIRNVLHQLFEPRLAGLVFLFLQRLLFDLKLQKPPSLQRTRN